MLKTLAVAALLSTACTDEPDCGEYPPAPGWVVAFETINGFERAVLTVPDYQNIAAWRDHVAQWAACKEGR